MPRIEYKPVAGRNPDIEIARLIGDAAHLLRQDFVDRAQAYGLTLLQWRALGELDRHDGWTQSELARQLEVDKMAMGRELLLLEEAKLIRRETDPIDARVKRVYRTQKLVNLYHELDQIIDRSYAIAFGGLGVDERKRLIETLQQIVARLQQPAD